jgi:iron(III) transport system permease protein
MILRLRARLNRAITAEAITCAACAVLLSWLVLYPLLVLLIGSLRTDLPMRPGAFTVANFTSLFASSENIEAILNTVVSSALATVLALLMGIPLAWVTSRTDAPGRRFFENVFVIPYYLSPFIGAIAWTLLANPRIGFINNLFVEAFGFEDAPLNIYSLGGMVFVMALYYSPIVYLFVGAGLRSMDPALEEASRIHGAGALATTLRVTLPVVMPSISSSALLVFLNAAGQFGIPAVIGIPAHYEVITTRIWIELGYFPPKYTEAAAFAVVLLAFSAPLLLVQRRMLSHRSYAVVTGKGFRPAVVKLGYLRYGAVAVCILYFLMSIVLPYGALIFTSFQPYLSFVFEPGSWTLHQYGDVLFNNPLTARATLNSLFLGGLGATVTIFFSLIISYAVQRTRARLRHLLDYVAIMPAGVPAVVFAVALLWGYIFLPLPIYGTIWMLLIAYIAHYIPFGVRSATSGLAQIGTELEESSRIHGGSWIGTMGRIVVPLLKPALTTGWILLFIEFIRSFSLSILLYTPESVVMPVVTFELYETGAYPALAAFSVLQTALMLVAIYAARKAAGVDSFMHLK